MIKITNETVKELILELFKRLVNYSSNGHIDKDFVICIGGLVFTVQTREHRGVLNQIGDTAREDLL